MAETGTITVIVAETHPVMRAGIRMLLADVDDVEIVAEAEETEAVKALAARHQPDVLVLDLYLTAPKPGKMVKSIGDRCPDTAVVILTARRPEAYLSELAAAGAVCCLSKAETTERLIGAVRRAARGERLFDARQLSLGNRWQHEVGRRWSGLTEREKEVLRLLAQFRTDVEIGSLLDISEKTVGHHVQSILRKLGASSRREVARWAIRHLPDLDLGRGRPYG